MLEGALALAASHAGPQDPFVCAALEASRVGTWRIDMISHLSSWDAVTSAIFGIEPVARVNAEPLLKVHADDKARVAERLEQCFRDGAQHEVVFRTVGDD